MCEQIKHRGPDDAGTWVGASEGIALGHRRLSILDLSSAGHQPMESNCGRYVVVFNGEIYNFRQLRTELEGLNHAFVGRSDTEVLLAAVAQWGVDASLKRFVGMFAFALWDRKERALVLARDRMGEKPLYYGWCKDTFLFGSELKALRVHPSWADQVDRDVLALYLRRGYVPAPFSIHRHIFKLIPGTLLALNTSKARPGQLPKPKTYWSFHEVAKAGLRSPFSGSEADARAELDGLLRSTIGQQMVADVPLGAFLSGGVDSSTVVALMQAQSPRPVKTFAIGFLEAGYNEAEFAKAVANHLGTDHTELYVTAEDALAVLPKLPMVYDEPFSDQSQIPTLLVSELARQQVTVSLSGDAGDELFYGYSRYFDAVKIWNTLKPLPFAARSLLSRMLTLIPSRGWDAVLARMPSFMRPKGFRNFQGDNVRRLADMLLCAGPTDLYASRTAFWDKNGLVLGNGVPVRPFADVLLPPTEHSLEHHMMWRDSLEYLPDDILVKVDRASMAISLENRIPLLDHRVVEFALKVPLSMKVRHRQGKWLLRQVLCTYVPRKLIERPKMGFGVPLGQWLRGPLRDWAEDLLAERRLAAEGWLDPGLVREKWAQHRAGTHNWQQDLWAVLMFQAWLELQNQSPLRPRHLLQAQDFRSFPRR